MKRWVKAGRSGIGVTSVTVTLQEGIASAKWAVKSAPGHDLTGVRVEQGHDLLIVDLATTPVQVRVELRNVPPAGDADG